jgi:hypothetical protein
MHGVLVNEKPFTEYEKLSFVMKHIRPAFPRINTLWLNTKGTKDELTAQRAVELIDVVSVQRGFTTKFQ